MKLNESTIAHFFTMMHGMVPSVKSIGIVTAENPLQEELKKDENKQRNLKLEKQIIQDGYGFINIKGKYGLHENPFIIQNITKDDLLKYGRTYDQESVIYGNVSNPQNLKYEFISLVNPNDNKYRNVFIKYDKGTGKVLNNYSKYKGKQFQIPLFDEKIEDPNDHTKEIPNPKTTIGKKFVHKKMPNGLDNTVIESRFDKEFRKIMKQI